MTQKKHQNTITKEILSQCAFKEHHEYRYYRVDKCDDGGIVQYFNRIDGKFVEANFHTKPGKIVKSNTHETYLTEKVKKSRKITN